MTNDLRRDAQILPFGSIELLRKTRDKIDCSAPTDDNMQRLIVGETAWFYSDLTYAYLKNGEYKECYEIAELQLSPYSSSIASVLDGQSDATLKALEHNRKLCGEQISLTFPNVKAAKCKSGGFAMPSETLPSGVSQACLVHKQQKGKDGESLGLTFTLVTTQGGKTTSQKLRVAKDEKRDFENSSVACNIESVGFLNDGNGVDVIIQGGGRNCDGGTASDQFQFRFALLGSELSMKDSFAFYVH